MATETLKVPRRCVGVLPVVQAFLDMLDDNRNFCTICREKFEVANVAVMFGCCGLFYHLECASKWLNMPSYGEENILPLYATCTPCTARWDRKIFNAYFPPDELRGRIDSMASSRDVFYVPAGIPPPDTSLVDAVTHYGRLGIGVILGEMVGHDQAPLQQEDIPDLLDTLVHRFKHLTHNDQWEDRFN